MSESILKTKFQSNRFRYLLIGLVVLVIGITLVIYFINRGTIRMSDYISIQYSGANGFASAECQVDTDKMYQSLAGKEKDMEKLTNYKKLADSVEATVDRTDISNGSVISVQVTYDEDAAKAAGVKVRKAKYSERATGISAGTKINLFDSVAVTFAGISPEAYVVIKNNWQDEYLASLNFTADPVSDIRFNDQVTVTCSADYSEIARHGYIPDKTQVVYEANRLSTYAQSKDDIDETVLTNLKKDTADTIVSQTADTTFRMLYRATKDTAYLYAPNEEKADNVSMVGTYFLTRKNESEGGVDNYLYLLYQATVSNGTESKEIYFAFEFSQGYVTSDGDFRIESDQLGNRYTCYTEKETMISSLIDQKNSLYNVIQLQ